MSWPSSRRRCSRGRASSAVVSTVAPWSEMTTPLYDTLGAASGRPDGGAMSLDEQAFDERPPRLTHVIYNAALGHVRVRSEDLLPTTVEVPAGEVRFRRVLGASAPEA